MAPAAALISCGPNNAAAPETIVATPKTAAAIPTGRIHRGFPLASSLSALREPRLASPAISDLVDMGMNLLRASTLS